MQAQAYQNEQQNTIAAQRSSPRAPPYAAPGPQQQTSTGSSMILNILKAVSLFLGLIGVSLALHGYFNAKWFHETVQVRDVKCDNVGQNCEPITMNPDAACDKANQHLRETRKDAEKFEQACPSRWLVIPQVFILALVWVGTLVGLILLVAAGASQNNNLRLIDTVCHVVAGILTIVSALCLLGYSLDVIVTDYCDRLFKPTKEQAEQLGASNRPEFLDFEKKFMEKCNKELRELYFQWHILAGAFFAFLTAVLYFGIGVFTLIGHKGGHINPQMMGQGSMIQSQTQMQQPFGDVPKQTPSMPTTQSPS